MSRKEEVWETASREETVSLGERLGRAAEKNGIYALTGDLGAGKTAMAGGFARGLGITAPVTSPSFTLLKIYEEGRLPLYHFDVYRLETPEAAAELDLEEIMASGGVTLVEWADKLRGCMPRETVWISIEKDLQKGESYRKITLRRQEADQKA